MVTVRPRVPCARRPHRPILTEVGPRGELGVLADNSAAARRRTVSSRNGGARRSPAGLATGRRRKRPPPRSSRSRPACWRARRRRRRRPRAIRAAAAQPGAVRHTPCSATVARQGPGVVERRREREAAVERYEPERRLEADDAAAGGRIRIEPPESVPSPRRRVRRPARPPSRRSSRRPSGPGDAGSAPSEVRVLRRAP